MKISFECTSKITKNRLEVDRYGSTNVSCSIQPVSYEGKVHKKDWSVLLSEKDLSDLIEVLSILKRDIEKNQQ